MISLKKLVSKVMRSNGRTQLKSTDVRRTCWINIVYECFMDSKWRSTLRADDTCKLNGISSSIFVSDHLIWLFLLFRCQNSSLVSRCLRHISTNSTDFNINKSNNKTLICKCSCWYVWASITRHFIKLSLHFSCELLKWAFRLSHAPSHSLFSHPHRQSSHHY